jgi:glutamine amidotransferase-like uncharacterized protein
LIESRSDSVCHDERDSAPVSTDVVYADDWIFPDGSLRGKAAQVSSTFKKGRIILTGLHAELRKKTYDIVMRNLLWLADLQEELLPSPAAINSG